MDGLKGRPDQTRDQRPDSGKPVTELLSPCQWDDARAWPVGIWQLWGGRV